MFTVALVGPDGAGKTTVARELLRTLPMPATYLYMGVCPDSSNRLLPTTWLVRTVRRLRGTTPDPRLGGSGKAQGREGLRGFLRLANRIAEESYRQALTWWHRRSGHVVLFDRHFFADFYGTDVSDASKPWSRRVHGKFLSRFYPRPDLVIYLDAPAEILFSRKGEKTLESLRALQQTYEKLAEAVPHYLAVDASQPLETVVSDAAKAICEFAERRRPPISCSTDGSPLSTR